VNIDFNEILGPESYHAESKGDVDYSYFYDEKEQTELATEEPLEVEKTTGAPFPHPDSLLKSRSLNYINQIVKRKKSLESTNLERLIRDPYAQIWDCDYMSTSDEEDNDDEESSSDSDSDEEE